MKLDPASKPEKFAVKDPKSPILSEPFLRIGEGSVESTLIVATKQAVVVLPVDTDEDETPGPVPIDAIKAARTAKTDLKCRKDYATVEGKVAMPRDDDKYSVYPDFDKLLVDDKQVVCEIAVNAKTLYALAQTMGTDIVRLKVTGNAKHPVGVEPHLGVSHVVGARAAMLPYLTPASI